MENQPVDPIVVIMTAPDAAEGTRIAELLVNKKLAACVQVLPEIQSIYIWKDEVQRDREVLLLAKTVRAKFAELEREVRAIHSYETPEIIGLSIACGSEPYLSWLARSCAGS
jgi:periplasmic divalent cation tolerance protein